VRGVLLSTNVSSPTGTGDRNHVPWSVKLHVAVRRSAEWWQQPSFPGS